MKPIFTNQFFTSFNESNDTVMIEFNHTYPTLHHDVITGDIVVNNVQSETVSSIVLSLRDAMALQETLTNILNKKITK